MLQSMKLQRVGHDRDRTAMTSTIKSRMREKATVN